MEKTFTVNLDEAKERLTSFAKHLPPAWLLSTMAFLQSLNAQKGAEISVRVVDSTKLEIHVRFVNE